MDLDFNNIRSKVRKLQRFSKAGFCAALNLILAARRMSFVKDLIEKGHLNESGVCVTSNKFRRL